MVDPRVLEVVLINQKFNSTSEYVFFLNFGNVNFEWVATNQYAFSDSLSAHSTFFFHYTFFFCTWHGPFFYTTPDLRFSSFAYWSSLLNHYVSFFTFLRSPILHQVFSLKTAITGGPTGGPTGARPAARRAHDRPPLEHLHTKFQCCS